MANYERTGLTYQPYFLHFSFISQPCILPLYSSEIILAKDTHIHTAAQFRNFSSQSSSYSTWLHPLNPGFLKFFPPLSFGITFSSVLLLHLTATSPFSLFQFSLLVNHITCLCYVKCPEFYTWLIIFSPNTCLSGVLILSDSFNYQLYTSFSSVTQSCPTLYNPMNCSTPGLPVHHQYAKDVQIYLWTPLFS